MHVCGVRDRHGDEARGPSRNWGGTAPGGRLRELYEGTAGPSMKETTPAIRGTSLPPRARRGTSPAGCPRCIRRGQLAGALAIAGALLAGPDPSVAQDSRDVIASLSEGRHETALAVLSRLLNQNPGDPRLLTLQGIALTQAGQTDQALAAYRGALQAAPDSLAALQGAAQIEFQTGDPAAQARLERVVTIRPDNPPAHAMLGVLAFEAAACNTAVHHFKRAGAALVQDRQALWQFGQCSFDERDVHTATKVFRRLLGLDSTDAAARFNLALSLLEAKLPADAIEIVEPSPLVQPLHRRCSACLRTPTLRKGKSARRWRPSRGPLPFTPCRSATMSTSRVSAWSKKRTTLDWRSWGPEFATFLSHRACGPCAAFSWPSWASSRNRKPNSRRPPPWTLVKARAGWA